MWRAFLRYMVFRRVGAVVLENILMVFCVLDAVHFQTSSSVKFHGDPGPYIAKAEVFALVFQLFLYLCDVYDLHKTLSFAQLSVRLSRAVAYAFGTLALLYFAIPQMRVGTGVFAISLLMISLYLTIWHTLLRVYVGIRSPRARILILGTGRLARELVSEILRHPELGLAVCGFVDDNPALLGTSIVNPCVIGLCQDLPQLAVANKVNRVVIELQDRRGRLPLEGLLKLKILGIAIEDAASLYERVTGKIAIENLKPSWLIFNAGFEVSRFTRLQKRFLSIVFSSTLLLLFAPVMALVMLLIKLDSRGPVFHKQERVGKDGTLFTLWKFRSMRVDAERKTGPVWSKPGDCRVTNLGKILRRTRLDELPQLYNILRGDMTLVGPRPERPHFVSELASMVPFYHLRHTVKPGVTGWAQVNYEYGNSVLDAVEKLQFDLFYIKHMSWLFDLVIILQTIKTVLVREGS